MRPYVKIDYHVLKYKLTEEQELAKNANLDGVINDNGMKKARMGTL